MDVRIGVTQTPKEILVELPEGTDQAKLARRGRRPRCPPTRGCCG